MAFAGRLDAASIGALWRSAIRAAEHAHGQTLVFDLSAVSFSDVGGASFLAAIEAAHGDPAELVGARERVTALLLRARAATRAVPHGDSVPRVTVRDVIAAAFGLLAASIGFIGEAAVAIVRLPARRRMLRVPDLLRYIDQAGVRSLPLILLLGYLIGLILAFQSAIPMRRFGADIFVANLVAISLVRELGPLLAAVILAGRTGSAFAAEIGTMKVNEEIDALMTMGLDPMTMLVLPRIIAAMLVMPVMTMALDIAGMLGHGDRDAWLRLSAGDDRPAGAGLGGCRRSVWRSVQGDVLRYRGRRDRLPRRAEHRRRTPRRRSVDHRGGGRRHCCHDRARRCVRPDLLSAGPVTAEPIIRVDDVAQRFGARTIFRDVSFTVDSGEVFVILGGSGCGKSTLMKQLIGLLTPSTGRIEIFGRAITGADRRGGTARRAAAGSA